jgi:signal peptidase II
MFFKKRFEYSSKILLVIVLISSDQILKYIINNTSPALSVCNPYIAWGIHLQGIWLWMFLIFSLVLLGYFLKNNFSYPLLLIIAGALSNMIDRLHFNCVIDFISLSTIPLINKIIVLTNFPIFNLADIFISIGIIWLLII